MVDNLHERNDGIELSFFTAVFKGFKVSSNVCAKKETLQVLSEKPCDGMVNENTEIVPAVT